MDYSDIDTRLMYLSHIYIQSKRSCLMFLTELTKHLSKGVYITENTEELSDVLSEVVYSILSQLETVYFQDLSKLKTTRDKIRKSELCKSNQWNQKYEELTKQLYKVFQIISQLTPILKFVFGANSEINKWGVVAQIDKLCRTLNSQARVIIRPRWQYMYTYFPISTRLYQLSELAQGTDSKLGKAILDSIFSGDIQGAPIFSSLSYPPIASDNVLHLAIWGHEIGHYIDNLEGIKRSHLEDSHITPNLYLSTIIAKQTKIKIDETLEVSDIFSGKSLADDDAMNISDNPVIDINLKIIQYRDDWASEVFADIFSIRLFGPSALFSLIDFCKPIPDWIDLVSPIHISIRTRIRIMMIAFDKWFTPLVRDSYPSKMRPFVDLFNKNLEFLRKLATENVEPHFVITDEDIIFRENYPYFEEKIFNLVDDFILEIEKMSDDIPDCFIFDDDMELIFKGVIDLINDIPPEFIQSNSKGKYKLTTKTLQLSVNSGWIFWLYMNHNNHETGNFQMNINDSSLIYQNLCKLLQKSIEDAETREWYYSRLSSTLKDESIKNIDEDALELSKKTITSYSGGVLTKHNLVNRINRRQNDLIIRPLLDEVTQIGTSSLDIRLGNVFIVTKFPLISHVDPSEYEISSKAEKYQEKIHLPYGKPFILHPRQFVLASSIEYFAIPNDIMGLMLDRESWGRLGLVMATRSKLIPGYKGCITLSLTNIGNAPIPLYPCSRIGQIIFYSTHEEKYEK